ncbi:hypothetical protein C8R41DRAFT_83757 [Lentinula lateritia]|uniref:Secreted protein n=1 Tax=Lentinula lateritia TaxID=40482 RepID=A0ABQ8VSZ5_9AGAR|nr:hypothetical protein C8R41DRAFT_83757 [Lentinula lateritia]
MIDSRLTSKLGFIFLAALFVIRPLLHQCCPRDFPCVSTFQKLIYFTLAYLRKPQIMRDATTLCILHMCDNDIFRTWARRKGKLFVCFFHDGQVMDWPRFSFVFSSYCHVLAGEIPFFRRLRFEFGFEFQHRWTDRCGRGNRRVRKRLRQIGVSPQNGILSKFQWNFLPIYLLPSPLNEFDHYAPLG